MISVKKCSVKKSLNELNLPIERDMKAKSMYLHKEFEWLRERRVNGWL